MKNYDNVEKISILVRDYKASKVRERQWNAEDASKEALKNYSDKEIELFKKQTDSCEEKKKEYKAKASAEKTIQTDIKQQIIDICLDDYKGDTKSAKIEEKLPLGSYASATFVRETKYDLSLTPEQKEELIIEIADNGMYDLLDINKEAYIRFAKEKEKELNQQFTGVVRRNEGKITIR